MPSSGPTKPVVEAPPNGERRLETSDHALRLRIRQEEILAELGVTGLKGIPFLELLKETVRLSAEGLEAQFCKALEYIPSENRLLMRAGVGWDEDLIGTASVGADLASPSGFALRTGKPVISNHLESEERFRTPELLAVHGVRRAMNVILQGDGAPYGVLEVDSRSEGEFTEHDIAFLQGAANILGMAIERQRHERQLRMALDRQQVLLNEINHRVKNSLQIVAAMLQLRANAADDDLIRAHLTEASGRVSAIGRAYERLSHDANVESINLGPYLQQVCADAVGAYRCILDFDAAPGIELDPDRAISLALIVNELVTNAVKHALSDRSNGHIWVRLSRQDENSALISVRDDGVGLPAGFDLTKSRGLGMRIIAALAKQLGASITQHGGVDGTEFALLLPLERRSES